MPAAARSRSPGSLGLAVINQTTTAELAGPVVLTGGDATITAASNAASTVKAEPTAGGVTSTSVGVGASVALNLITDTTTATIDNGITLTGAANVTLSATAGDAAITEAKMGASGGKVDIAPADRRHALERDHDGPRRHRRRDAR